MSDFDDYFADDIILDDTVLAVLDAEEDKFKQTQQHPRPSQLVPAPKRQKTEQGWKSTIPATQSDSFYDDLPEISIYGDGTYGLLGVQQSTLPNTFRTGMPVHSVALQSRLNSRNSAPSSTAAGPSKTIHSYPPSQVQRQPSSSRPPQSHSAQVISQNSRSSGQPSSQNSNLDLQRKQNGRPSANAAPPGIIGTSASGQIVNDEILALRIQLEQLNKSHEETRQALKTAQDAQFAKEGEVSILRKNMEKTAQEHGANIARLKAARESAEAMQAQVQKEMRDEIERVKTQFMFKQRELETSVRKPPWSIRGKKVSKEPPPTPLNMQHWNQPDFPAAGPSNVRQTPSRPRSGSYERGSSDAHRTVQPSQPHRPSQMLPGFVNSFHHSSPLKSPGACRPSVKEAAKNNDKAKQKTNNTIKLTQPRGKLSPQSSPTASQYEPMDVRMDDGVESHVDGDFDEDEESRGEFDEIEPINWAAELHHIIFTHTSSSSITSTVQTLMSVNLLPLASESNANLFSRASTELWTILASISTFEQLPASYLFRRVSESLTKIALVLNAVNLVPALTAVLSLLKTLTFFISSFCGPLLSTCEDAENQDPRVVTLLCDVVRNHLTPLSNVKTTSKMTTLKQRQGELDPTQTALAEETLGLFEALCWNAPDGLEIRLVTIVRGERVLDMLLDTRQPSWLLYRTVRGLVLFASRSGLSRHLLSFPEATDLEKETDYSRIPHIERLCEYLADNSRQSLEAESARSGILTLLSTLSITHADARAILLESEQLIPSLVSRLTHLTALLWEDDERLLFSPEVTNSTSRSLCQTLFLLHDLVFNTQPQLDLKQKIHNANPANGIDHMFNVTFGRLTYAPDLVWVPEETNQYLIQITETAREILQVVVDGAEEEDMIYAAYQEEEPDDEEMEAMQLEANDL